MPPKLPIPVLFYIAGWPLVFWRQWAPLCPEPHHCALREGGVLLSTGTGTALKGIDPNIITAHLVPLSLEFRGNSHQS